VGDSIVTVAMWITNGHISQDDMLNYARDGTNEYILTGMLTEAKNLCNDEVERNREVARRILTPLIEIIEGRLNI
jgi:hypothetical protein